ncbi:hypothetical protein TB2_032800 [Malus domestica]
MLIRTLRWECRLPKRLACGWSSGCLPGHCWKGLSALVLLRDTSSGARWIPIRCKSLFTKVVCCARALVNSMTCRDKCCSPFGLEELGRNAPPWAVEGW